MKRILTIITLSLLTLSGCKKDDTKTIIPDQPKEERTIYIQSLNVTINELSVNEVKYGVNFKNDTTFKVMTGDRVKLFGTKKYLTSTQTYESGVLYLTIDDKEYTSSPSNAQTNPNAAMINYYINGVE